MSLRKCAGRIVCSAFWTNAVIAEVDFRPGPAGGTWLTIEPCPTVPVSTNLLIACRKPRSPSLKVHWSIIKPGPLSNLHNWMPLGKRIWIGCAGRCGPARQAAAVAGVATSWDRAAGLSTVAIRIATGRMMPWW